jgi:hypothetical protein
MVIYTLHTLRAVTTAFILKMVSLVASGTILYPAIPGKEHAPVSAQTMILARLGHSRSFTLDSIVVVRGRVSLVPDTTFIACCSLYTGGFFRAAYPDSSHVPWPSPLHTRLGILLTLAGFKLTMRQDSLHVAACNVASPYWAFHRASPLGSPHQVPASYEAVWSLPRPDSHRLVVPSLARRAANYLTLTF